MAATCFSIAPLTFALPQNIKFHMTTTVFAVEAVLFLVYAAMTFLVLKTLSPELEGLIVFLQEQVGCLKRVLWYFEECGVVL